MTSPNEPKPSKKRVGRKRLPPLAPGPALQFVVASHPDQFKEDKTLRNIRSHVMYKHRGEQRGGSPRDRSKSRELDAKPSVGTRTPSPMTTISDGILEDNNLMLSSRRRSTIWDGDFYKFMSRSPQTAPMRSLAARIISAATTTPARSVPATFDEGAEYPFPSSSSFSQESLEELKNLYLDNGNFCRDRSWMEAVCSNRMSFLSHVSVACVYQDVGESLLEDSPLTVYAKTKVLQMIKDSLQGFDTQTDDFTILSILHLLISECGGFDEDVFDVHQEGLVRIIYQRGGIGNLGMNGKIAAFMTLTILSFTILRGLSEPAMLHGFVPSQRPSIVSEYPPPISPLYAPNGDLSAIYGHCSDSTYELLCDMHDITRTFIARWNYISGAFTPRSSSELASYDTHMGEIYTRLLYRPRTDEDLTPDYVYESCRLAGLIYCRSLVQGLPLSESGNVMYARSSGVNIGEGYSSRSSNTTIISALHDALDSTDKSDSWCAMCGVFIWICFVGGAASWPSTHSVYGERGDVQVPAAWVRKCFALYTVKAGLSLGFERAAAIAEAQRTMLQVQNLINLKRGIASQ